MFTLLNELHFWTLKDEIAIRDSDFGSFRYYEKRAHQDDGLVLGKKSYSEKRGITWSPSNKRPAKLKDNLKELEELLDTVRVVHIQWEDSNQIQVVLNSGHVATLNVNPVSGDIRNINLDRSLAGKLLSDYISDAVVSRQNLIFTYADHQVTVVGRTNKSALRLSGSGNTLRRWAGVGGDVKIETGELNGPSGRRLGRKLCFNTTNDKVLVWWKSGKDEVYPWSPVVRDQDRANVHIYSIKNLKLELICYFRTEFEPIVVTFSSLQPNLVHSIYQKISDKGEVEAGWKRTEVLCSTSAVQPLMASSFAERNINLRVPACSASLSPQEDRLLLACVDCTILIVDSDSDCIVLSTKASFIASSICWHWDGCLLAVSSERGQLQFYDSALASVRAQLVSDDIVPANIIDVGAYFKHQPTLLNMYWNKKCESQTASPDCFLLLHFERGPLGVVRVVGGERPGLGAEIIVSQYLSVGTAERAIAVLSTLGWNKSGHAALPSLQAIIRHLTSRHLTPERQVLLERALGCFYTPSKLFSEATDMEFGDSVHDLTRKVFHHFLRYQVVDKAFQLAIDISDYDLFMDLHNVCKASGLKEMADAALEKAEEISEYSSTRSGASLSSSASICSSTSSSSSFCSNGSSCSECEAQTRKDSKPSKQTGTTITSSTNSSQNTSKHKVKFSDTVTRITLPALDDSTVSSPEDSCYLTSENVANLSNLSEYNQLTLNPTQETESKNDFKIVKSKNVSVESLVQDNFTQSSPPPSSPVVLSSPEYDFSNAQNEIVKDKSIKPNDSPLNSIGIITGGSSPIIPSEESDSIKSYHENDSLLSAPTDQSIMKQNDNLIKPLTYLESSHQYICENVNKNNYEDKKYFLNGNQIRNGSPQYWQNGDNEPSKQPISYIQPPDNESIYNDYSGNYYKVTNLLPDINDYTKDILPSSIKGTSAYHSRELTNSSNDSNYSSAGLNDETATKDSVNFSLIPTRDKTDYNNCLNQKPEASEQSVYMKYDPSKNIHYHPSQISNLRGPPKDNECININSKYPSQNLPTYITTHQYRVNQNRNIYQNLNRTIPPQREKSGYISQHTGEICPPLQHQQYNPYSGYSSLHQVNRSRDNSGVPMISRNELMSPYEGGVKERPPLTSNYQKDPLYSGDGIYSTSNWPIPSSNKTSIPPRLPYPNSRGIPPQIYYGTDCNISRLLPPPPSSSHMSQTSSYAGLNRWQDSKYPDYPVYESHPGRFVPNSLNKWTPQIENSQAAKPEGNYNVVGLPDPALSMDRVPSSGILRQSHHQYNSHPPPVASGSLHHIDPGGPPSSNKQSQLSSVASGPSHSGIDKDQQIEESGKIKVVHFGLV